MKRHALSRVGSLKWPLSLAARVRKFRPVIQFHPSAPSPVFPTLAYVVRPLWLVYIRVTQKIRLFSLIYGEASRRHVITQVPGIICRKYDIKNCKGVTLCPACVWGSAGECFRSLSSRGSGRGAIPVWTCEMVCIGSVVVQCFGLRYRLYGQI
jgi:hypothetical protein